MSYDGFNATLLSSYPNTSQMFPSVREALKALLFFFHQRFNFQDWSCNTLSAKRLNFLIGPKSELTAYMRVNEKKKDIWWTRRWFTRLVQKIFGLFVFRSFTLTCPLTNLPICHLTLSARTMSPSTTRFFLIISAGWFIVLRVINPTTVFFLSFFPSFYKHPTPTRVHGHSFIGNEGVQEQRTGRTALRGPWASCYE